MEEENNNGFNETEKAKKGWLFSVIFLIAIICLILFLSFFSIQEKNRDVLVGLLGVITGNVGSMIAVASGRDPSEIADLKDKLAKANADRQALISRLRDAQIQMQLLREQQFELQQSIIKKISILSSDSKSIRTVDESQVMLHPAIEEWLPKDKD